MTPEQARNGETAWLNLTTTRIGQSVMPAGQESLMLRLPRSEENAEVWERLNRERFKVRFDACYCSLLGECWRSDLTGLEPRKVETCPASGGYLE